MKTGTRRWQLRRLALALLGCVPAIGLTVRAAPRAERRVTLYDGSLNTGTPDTQGFLYLARPQTPRVTISAFTSPASCSRLRPVRSLNSFAS